MDNLITKYNLRTKPGKGQFTLKCKKYIIE